MASYFGQPAADLIAAGDISDDTAVALRISGPQSGVVPLHDARRFAVPFYTRRPRITDRMGMCVCISGADRGLYWNTGTEVIQKLAFAEDGSYADATWANMAFGLATSLDTDTIDVNQCGLVISGSQEGRLTLGEFAECVVIWSETALPVTADPVGHYGVQTGGNKGWYYNTGTDIYQILTYSQDGRWPV